MKLSRSDSYAVQATLQLAQDESAAPIPCSRLAAEGNMPERFLLQILRLLVTHGILVSSRGVDGGYMLERSPKDISLRELIEAIDGPLDSKSIFQGNLSSETHKKLSQAFQSVTEITKRKLDAVKLSQLIPSDRK